MTTPVHLSGTRPASAAAASAQPASQPAGGKGGAQAAMFDLLFALQLGAGGWEAQTPEVVATSQDEALESEPGVAAAPMELTAPTATAQPDPATTPPMESADPAALLWNPFSERTASDAKPAAAAGDAEASPASPAGTVGEKDSARSTRSGATHNPTLAMETAPKDAAAPSEYSQVQTATAHESDSAIKPGATQAPPVVQHAPPPALPVAASLDAPMGTPAFREQLATQVAVFIDQKQLAAQIQVHPPELGPVDVQIKLNAEQIDVDFFATQADARDAIENAIPRLREMLAEQGLSLGGTHVGTRDDPRAFAHTTSQGWHGNPEGGDGSKSRGTAPAADPSPVIRRSLRLVDTFA